MDIDLARARSCRLDARSFEASPAASDHLGGDNASARQVLVELVQTVAEAARDGVGQDLILSQLDVARV